MQTESSSPRAAIACGGTGGHLFPGLAVAEQLKQRGCRVTLLISPKDIDQKAAQTAKDIELATLPAVGLVRGKRLAFVRGFAQSYRAARKLFKSAPPEAVLAMGGFTSAPPVMAARARRVPTFLHESNTIPGKANRWLSRFVSEAFVGFPETADKLKAKKTSVTGTPVRLQFQPADAAACRVALGLDPQRPVLLVTGGSQGASGVNDVILAALPILAKALPQMQLLHLTGPMDIEQVRQICADNKITAFVLPFFEDMHVALGAATAVVSRAGASSLAELAAMRVPAILMPYPAATDNHQYYNAQAYVKSGAAQLLEQRDATPEILTVRIVELIENTANRERIKAALAAWHAPRAAEQIAETMMQVIMARRRATGAAVIPPPPPSIEHRQSIIA